MKKGKVALLFNSRNNYNLFEDIFFKHTTVDFSNHYIFNIDLNSHLPEQKEFAKKVFEKYNIIDIKVDYNDPNIFCATRTMELCIDYIEKNNLDIACNSCNCSKRDKTDLEYREWRKKYARKN